MKTYEKYIDEVRTDNLLGVATALSHIRGLTGWMKALETMVTNGNKKDALATLANIKKQLPKAEKIIKKSLETMVEGKAEAQKYVNKIKNKKKKEYAKKYLAYKLGKGDRPEKGELSAMGAQAVEMWINDYIK